MVMILLVSKLFLALSRLDDRTNLASEISKAAILWLGCAGEWQFSDRHPMALGASPCGPTKRLLVESQHTWSTCTLINKPMRLQDDIATQDV